jgi:hypothetical protein
MVEVRNAYICLESKPEGKRPLRIRTHRWEDKIRMDLREIGWEVVDWIHVDQDSNQWHVPVNSVNKLLGSKGGEFLH